MLALLIAGCSGPAFPLRAPPPPPPRPQDWGIGFTRLQVVDPQEDRQIASFSVSNGDEPYLILIGFKGELGIEGSVQMVLNRYEDDEWAENTRARSVVRVPEPMAILRFNDVSATSVIGILAIAMESDRTPWPIIADRVTEITTNLQQAARREIEQRTLLDPSDTAFIDNLHQSMIEAANPLATSISAGEALENIIFSGIDTDEVIGMNALLFMLNPPAREINLPYYIRPYFADALQVQDYPFDTFPLIFVNSALRARYNVELRVGKYQ